MANGACSVRIVAPVARPDDVVVPVGAVVGGKVVVVAERGDAEVGLGPVDLAMGDIVILEYHSLATKVGIYTLLLLPLLVNFGPDDSVAPGYTDPVHARRQAGVADPVRAVGHRPASVVVETVVARA